MIKVQNLVFDYMTKRALHNISFEIKKGSIVALIGPNGAGKTTLMRCLAGLVKPFSGDVFIDNINVSENPRLAHRHISYLSDVFGLYDELTAYECLKYAALAYGIADKNVDEAVKKVAKRLGLSPHLESYAGNLSRGLRQKLAIAQVIIHGPKFIILDEPASGLDPDARLELSKLFVDLKQEGHTLLISSHILAELEDYATDIIVLNNGRLIKNEKASFTKSNTIGVQINALSKQAKLVSYLQKNDKVSHVFQNENLISFNFDGKDKDLSVLLKEIFESGYELTEFVKQKSLVKSAYFETLKKGE